MLHVICAALDFFGGGTQSQRNNMHMHMVSKVFREILRTLQ